LRKELQAELMLAYYFDNQPYLYTVDLSVSRCDKAKSWWSAIGCGANLGAYLLSEHTKPKMDRGLCLTVAPYIINTVCKHDAYCSPPASLGIILNDIGESAKKNDSEKQIHPKAFGLGLVVISTATQPATPFSRKIEKIMQDEKERRNKAIDRLLRKENKRAMKIWNDFQTNRTTKSARELAKLFSGSGIATFDSFKSK